MEPINDSLNSSAPPVTSNRVPVRKHFDDHILKGMMLGIGLSILFVGVVGVAFALLNNGAPVSNSNQVLSNIEPAINTPVPSTVVAATTTAVADPYAGWTEYKNEEYGVAFKVPKQFYITGKLVDSKVTNEVFTEGGLCTFYFDGGVLKSKKYCKGESVDTSRTLINGSIFLWQNRPIGGPCEGTQNMATSDGGYITVLGEQLYIKNYYDTDDINSDCNGITLYKTKPTDNTTEQNVYSLKSKTDKWNSFSFNLKGYKDNSTQKGVSDIEKKILESLRYL